MSAWAPAVSATCLTRPRRTPRHHLLSTRSTPWAASAAAAWAAATTSGSRPSTNCWWRWTASPPTRASSSGRHQPGGYSGSGPAASRPVRPAGVCRSAGYQGPRGDPQIHARNKPLAEDVDLSKIARGTAGLHRRGSGEPAQRGSVAVRPTGRRHDPTGGIRGVHHQGHRRAGEAQPRHSLSRSGGSPHFHEAGHAVVMRDLPGQDPVHQITIVPRGQAGGMTISLPEEDRSYLSSGTWRMRS